MQIHQNNDQFTITLPNSINAFSKQKLIDYARYLELTSQSKAKQKDADNFAEEVNASWWEKNKKRFVK